LLQVGAGDVVRTLRINKTRKTGQRGSICNYRVQRIKARIAETMKLEKDDVEMLRR